MLMIPSEDKALLVHHLTESARLMRKYTEPEKLTNFESIEIEVRNQMLEVVGPTIGEFFFQMGEQDVRETGEKSRR